MKRGLQTDLVSKQMSASIEMLEPSSWVGEGALTQFTVITHN